MWQHQRLGAFAKKDIDGEVADHHATVNANSSPVPKRTGGSSSRWQPKCGRIQVAVWRTCVIGKARWTMCWPRKTHKLQSGHPSQFTQDKSTCSAPITSVGFSNISAGAVVFRHLTVPTQLRSLFALSDDSCRHGIHPADYGKAW